MVGRSELVVGLGTFLVLELGPKLVVDMGSFLGLGSILVMELGTELELGTIMGLGRMVSAAS